MSNRTDLITALRAKYIPTRLEKVEIEFVEFEERMCSVRDLERILTTPQSTLPNPHNSVLLYLVGCTDDYDANQVVDTIGGSYCDIDVDFDTKDFRKIFDWIIEHYGRESVANILTYKEFKPRTITEKYFQVTMPTAVQYPDPKELQAAINTHLKAKAEIKDMIPDDLFGKTATIDEIVNGNKHKGFKPHSEILTNPIYKAWYDTAIKLEGLVNNQGIHASGVVIADEPIWNQAAMTVKMLKDEWSQEDFPKWVAQATMDELAELGLTKFDLLRIESLAIIKECLALIKERHNISIDPWKIADDDKDTYKLIGSGRLSGVFQLEASKLVKDYCMKVKPSTLRELSDLSALCRPGPLQAGLMNKYLENRELGAPPSDMPPLMAELLKSTYWTLVYQEQLIAIVCRIAGFTLLEGDGVRKATGKKDLEKLKPYRDAFINGCIKFGVTAEYAIDFWDNTILGYSDYAFNMSHSICYLYQGYVCAWLKSHYTIEFFTAMMSIKSQVLQPQKWMVAAPTCIQEAREFGIEIKPPDVNRSTAAFNIDGNGIYFGLSSISGIGHAATQAVLDARGTKPFASIEDFLQRINLQKVHSGNFTSLVVAGCFDSLGYRRADLLEAAETLYERKRWERECSERVVENYKREQENIEIQALIEQRDEIRKKLKKKGYQPSDEEQEFLEANQRILLKRPLKMPTEVVVPTLVRYKRLAITTNELLKQGEKIGCYIVHPAKLAYPNTTSINDIDDGGVFTIAGIVGDIRTYKNSYGNRSYVAISDGTGTVSLAFYEKNGINVPTKNSLIQAKIKVDRVDIDEDDNCTIKVSRVLHVDTFVET